MITLSHPANWVIKKWGEVQATHLDLSVNRRLHHIPLRYFRIYNEGM